MIVNFVSEFAEHTAEEIYSWLRGFDFLPFDCDGCGNTYCLEHKAKDDHHCSKQLLQTATADYTGPKAYHCAIEGCSHRELTPIACEHCHLNFCLSHRHQQEHKCSQLKPGLVPNAQTAQHVAAILATKDPPAAKKPLKSLKARLTAARVALMKLKGRAEGDKGLPDEERVFFSVAMPLDSKVKPKALFFSKKWSVGRVIDVIADKADIHNPNNTAAAQKLRLFAADSGQLLPVEQSLQEVMSDDLGLYSGSSLIMEAVPDSVTLLPDCNKYNTAT